MRQLIGRLDPQKLGEALMELRQWNSAKTPKHVPLSSLYDSHEDDLIHLVPEYDSSESLGTITVLDRHRELMDRANAGDRFAAAILAGDSLAEEPVD